MRLLRRGRPARARREPRPEPRRHPSYWLVAGVDLAAELKRLRALDVFAGGPLDPDHAAPLLRVRRASKRPNRLGFAVPDEWRLSVTDYPGIRRGDALETLLHELVHLHVGRSPGAHAWHGREFKRTLARAMAEAYGVRPQAQNSLHGVYAEAIERRLAADAAGGEQLRLTAGA